MNVKQLVETLFTPSLLSAGLILSLKAHCGFGLWLYSYDEV